jgi:hypothetical protein
MNKQPEYLTESWSDNHQTSVCVRSKNRTFSHDDMERLIKHTEPFQYVASNGLMGAISRRADRTH